MHARAQTTAHAHAHMHVAQVSFFADVRRLRRLYEPLGCRVTLATVLRHPLNLYLSWFNWRASNYLPLCAWDPPRDPQSRQLLGWGLPFVSRDLVPERGGRTLEISMATVRSVLAHFDVVGLTERFDETLLMLANASGMRHLGYARLAANNKPDHPNAAKLLLDSVLADSGANTLTTPLDIATAPEGRFLRGLEDGHSFLNSSSSRAIASAKAREWSTVTTQAIGDLNRISLEYVLKRNAGSKSQPVKADCNFYPCTDELSETSIVTQGMCKDVKEHHMLARMIEKTTTDRGLHAEVLHRFDARLAELRRAGPAGALQLKLLDIKAKSKALEIKRVEVFGRGNSKLCGVRLCGNPLRSCVGCEPNVVPGMEPCWPSWEDQFSPDEQKVFCKRSMTFPGYDAAEIKARLYPKVAPIPCWQTCWEPMVLNASGPHGRSPTCLEKDAPPPNLNSKSGPSCQDRALHCTPSCGEPSHPSLSEFWKAWEEQQKSIVPTLGIACPPCGHGG
uniref:Uncharacterized protein n=1 Tax=Haptolina brevifila TaxID=156173 RepID=A0A7S2GI19_9EUKA|mmetsp:Transcript_38520/g.77145  ORF Transcript_38520/g.77145 Transcript_38520/m.77145 type:complete len:505 (+) Transcript_38520:483-1997(+)